MKKPGVLTVTCCLLLFYVGCDTVFVPNVNEPRMVVYSVLTTDSDTQFVRVYRTYNPPNDDPSKNQDEQPITDARVTVTSGSEVHQFQQFTISRPDTSRYASKIVAYMCYPFRPSRGKTYSLTVVSPTFGNAASSTTVPGIASISPINFICLENPYVVGDENYGVKVFCSGSAKAYLVRIFVDYLVPTPQGDQPKRVQVPIRVKPNSRGTYETYVLSYSTVMRRQTTNSGYADVETFPTKGWYDMLEHVIAYQDGKKCFFVQAVFQVIQFDVATYNAYAVSHPALDSISIRPDSRDYSNIYGGAGIFGSMAVDSTINSISTHIFPQ